MNDLKQLYETLMSNPDNWRYYDFEPRTLTDNQDLFDVIIEEPSSKFIKELLKRGGKGDIRSVEEIETLSSMRRRHTISCFLLGNEIYNRCPTIKTYIDNLIREIRPNEIYETEKERFRYIWMLICLFHDLGYNYEEKHSVYDSKDIESAITQLLKEKTPVGQPYTKTIVRKYHKYRKEGWGILDHGIVGGALLYHDLCELRKIKEPIDNTLYWGKKLEMDFLIGGWTIACHNIFSILPNDSSEGYYRFFKLEKLITTDKIIILEKCPLLYLLCLVDSMEPIKIIGNNSLLKEIEIEIQEDKISLNIKKLPDMPRCKYIGKLLSMETWLANVTVETEEMIVNINF